MTLSCPQTSTPRCKLCWKRCRKTLTRFVCACIISLSSPLTPTALVRTVQVRLDCVMDGGSAFEANYTANGMVFEVTGNKTACVKPRKKCWFCGGYFATLYRFVQAAYWHAC